jgi:hypothetical protein
LHRRSATMLSTRATQSFAKACEAVEDFLRRAVVVREEIHQIVGRKRVVGASVDNVWWALDLAVNIIDENKNYLLRRRFRVPMNTSMTASLTMVERETRHMEAIIRRCLREIDEFFEDARSQQTLNFGSLLRTFNVCRSTVLAFFQLNQHLDCCRSRPV